MEMEVVVAVAGYCVFTIWHSGARPWCCQKLGTGSAQPSPGPVRAVIRKIYRLLFVYCPLASQNKVRVTRCYLRPNTLWALEWCQRWCLNVFQNPVDTLHTASLVAQTKGQWSQGGHHKHISDSSHADYILLHTIVRSSRNL